ncbi:hypothetical protein SFUMM280S_06887 [Streptomyces fumanus]
MGTQTVRPVTGPARTRRPGRLVIDWLTTTDHKKIGHLYLITSFVFFLIAGVMALLMRAELARPGLQLVDNQQFNQLFTMHGTIMLLLFATPSFAGFANELMPLQIGAPDVAFPRLNMLSYWLFLFGGLIVLASLLVPSGPAAFGWFAYAPLNSQTHSPGIGADLWIMGLALSGFGTILGAVNFLTTIVGMRAPGMTMFRMPIFVWNTLFTSILILVAFPVLAAALLVLEADRRFGSQVFASANGGALLWQHLFWFFGHPERATSIARARSSAVASATVRPVVFSSSGGSRARAEPVCRRSGLGVHRVAQFAHLSTSRRGALTPRRRRGRRRTIAVGRTGAVADCQSDSLLALH